MKHLHLCKWLLFRCDWKSRFFPLTHTTDYGQQILMNFSETVTWANKMHNDGTKMIYAHFYLENVLKGTVPWRQSKHWWRHIICQCLKIYSGNWIARYRISISFSLFFFIYMFNYRCVSTNCVKQLAKRIEQYVIIECHLKDQILKPTFHFTQNFCFCYVSF